MIDIDQVRDDLATLGDVNYCPQWFYSAIRHVQRNMELYCSTPEHADESGYTTELCIQPRRYDGKAIARLLAAIPALLDLVTEFRMRDEAATRVIERLSSGIVHADDRGMRA